MQTQFTEAQRADPDIRASEKILRACVHCGFCTATCPTYTLLGDENDSPRGRIYLIKQMLEGGGPATESVVKHVDRCLSCLSCMTTCPSGVNYMHLVDHARHHIAKTFRRPLPEQALRWMLGFVLPRPALLRPAMLGAKLARPLAPLLPGRLRRLVEMAPPVLPAPTSDGPQVFRAEGEAKLRVALMVGCAQRVLAPEINAATIRLLTRHGCDVVIAEATGCCGALNHHLGQDGYGLARKNIDAWMRERAVLGLDAIVINASGCGTTVKDYGFMFREDPVYAERAAKVADLACDITELMARIGLRAPVIATGQRVAYHSACSMQHGQRITRPPRDLLKAAGFEVAEIAEGHLCCGSAGTYNLLQPVIADQLRARKLGNIAATRPDLVATGNIGCITQLHTTHQPVVHTVELLDWATGGPRPAKLATVLKAASANKCVSTPTKLPVKTKA
jgi:glycolate oxidase iron-sulfur subunit